MTRGGGTFFYPTVDRGDRWLAYGTIRGDIGDVFVRDLLTGEDRALAASEANEQYPVISADGSLVAYGHIRGDRRRPIFAVPAAGGAARMICEDCGRPSEWSPDNHYLLAVSVGRLNAIHVVDTRTGIGTAFLESPAYSLGMPRFSPDGRWVAFQAMDSTLRSCVFLAPFRGSVTIPSSQWIAGPLSAFRPAWSPSGGLLYWLSIQGHNLREVALQARKVQAGGDWAGEAFDVFHFPEADPPELAAYALQSPLSISRNRAVLVLSQFQGDIWVINWSPSS